MRKIQFCNSINRGIGVSFTIFFILSIRYEQQVSGISPTTGSTSGGQKVTILGLGFNDLIFSKIFLGTAECKLEYGAMQLIVCVTSEHVEGVVSLQVSISTHFPSDGIKE